MDPLLDATPPESLQGLSSFNEKLSNKMYKSAFWARCLRQAVSLGQKDMVYDELLVRFIDFIELRVSIVNENALFFFFVCVCRDFMDLLLSPASKVLNNWFEVGFVI